MDTYLFLFKTYISEKPVLETNFIFFPFLIILLLFIPKVYPIIFPLNQNFINSTLIFIYCFYFMVNKMKDNFFNSEQYYFKDKIKLWLKKN